MVDGASLQLVSLLCISQWQLIGFSVQCLHFFFPTYKINTRTQKRENEMTEKKKYLPCTCVTPSSSSSSSSSAPTRKQENWDAVQC